MSNPLERRPADGISEKESRKELNDTIELLRLIASLGVIWFHMESVPFKLVGFAGLVFFLMTAAIFQAGGAQREKWIPYLRKRAFRLLIPWVAWFAIYAVLNIATGKSMVPASYG